jgi:tetratricopeptide (TPR) repeat protein
MPKLTPLQWIIVALLQVFYGFAVFALTRDYFQRPQAVSKVQSKPSASSNPHAAKPSNNASIMAERSLGESAIPESLVQKDPILLAQLGDERFRQRKYQDAIGIYRRVLELNPDDVDTYNDLGFALHLSGESAQAVAVLKQGVEKDPKFQRIWLTLGFVQMHTTERPEAGFALKEAIKLNSDNEVGQEAKRMLDQLDQP